MGKAIKVCLNMVGLNPSRIPIRSTVASRNVQRLMLAQNRLADEYVEEENTWCALSDETSK